jgi:hypothetical protein
VKYYKLCEDTEYAEVFFPHEDVIPDDIYLVAKQRHVPKLQVRWAANTLHLPKPNIPGGLGGTLFLDRVAWTHLRDLLHQEAHVFESAPGGVEFHLATPTTVYAALDEERSVGGKLSNGRWLSLSRAALRLKNIGPANIFRIAESGPNRHVLFCTERFRAIVASAPLTGLVFCECEVV